MRIDDALVAFARFCGEHKGVSPTRRELAERMGAVSSSVGDRWLRQLEREGLIENAVPEVAEGSRTYVLTERGRERYWTARRDGVA